ncbi:hypothetical protein OHU34_28605 [Streptomyces sp. NBC_00080]|uniref:hypothetical protein n=1 Tax=Streptomyces sp. NBC_00080 TaxID=2975645 RepID=UPI00324BC7CB
MYCCAYCFASFAGRQFGRSAREWGDYLYMKKNAADLAREELARMPEHKRHGTMLLSSVTDPYQGHETKYRLSRGILRELKTGVPGPGPHPDQVAPSSPAASTCSPACPAPRSARR